MIKLFFNLTLGYRLVEQDLLRRKGDGEIVNEEINFLKHCKDLVDKGYSVLMYDFRNHGNSSSGSCEWVTWGPEEAKDVLAAVEFISKMRPTKTPRSDS